MLIRKLYFAITFCICISIGIPASAANGDLLIENEGYAVHKTASHCQSFGPVLLELRLKGRKSITAEQVDLLGISRDIGMILPIECPYETEVKLIVKKRSGRIKNTFLLKRNQNWRANFTEADRRTLVIANAWWGTETKDTGILPDPKLVYQVMRLGEFMDGSYLEPQDLVIQAQLEQAIRSGNSSAYIGAGKITTLNNDRNITLIRMVDEMQQRLVQIPLGYDSFQKFGQTVKSLNKLQDLTAVPKGLRNYREPNGQSIWVEPMTKPMVSFIQSTAISHAEASYEDLAQEARQQEVRGNLSSYEAYLMAILGEEYSNTRIGKYVTNRRNIERMAAEQSALENEYYAAFMGAINPPNGTIERPFLTPAEQVLLVKHEQAQIDSLAAASDIAPQICTTRTSTYLYGGWAQTPGTSSTTCSPDMQEGKKRLRAKLAGKYPTPSKILGACQIDLKLEFCTCLANKNGGHFTQAEFDLFAQSPKTYAFYIAKADFGNEGQAVSNSFGMLFTGLAAAMSGNMESSLETFRKRYLLMPSSAGELATNCANP